jgi:hypothetical protein
MQNKVLCIACIHTLSIHYLYTIYGVSMALLWIIPDKGFLDTLANDIKRPQKKCYGLF